MRRSVRARDASASSRPAAASAGRSRARVAASAHSAQSSVEAQAWVDLVAWTKLKAGVALAPTEHGNGLRCTAPHKRGAVLVSVPRSLALVLDYNSDQALQVPEGDWPRLREGIAREDPLPWDLLFALAVLDGLAGDGGPFWQAWCQAVLPPPEALPLPMCWTPAQLAELQHPAIQQAAEAQQARLRALFPTLSQPVEGQACSWLAWAFACVRSRAFKLGNDAFAMVPFLDVANHAAPPNADFRLRGDAFELYALKDLDVDDEVCISYSDDSGYTNQRWQATYGFVPEGGNLADRLTFELPEPSASPSVPPQGLVLARAQEALGLERFAEAVGGRHARLHAALRSLPWLPEDMEELARAAELEQKQGRASSPPPGARSAGSEGKEGGEQSPDVRLAQALRDQLQSELQGCATTAEEDEAELSRLLLPPAPLGGGKEGSRAAADPCRVAALRYRLERKRLLQAGLVLLDKYLQQ